MNEYLRVLNVANTSPYSLYDERLKYASDYNIMLVCVSNKNCINLSYFNIRDYNIYLCAINIKPITILGSKVIMDKDMARIVMTHDYKMYYIFHNQSHVIWLAYCKKIILLDFINAVQCPKLIGKNYFARDIRAQCYITEHFTLGF